MSRLMISCLSVTFLCGILAAQATEPNWNDQIRDMSFLRQQAEEFRIGSGDLVELKVFGVDQFTQELRVNGSGTIEIPLIGTLPVSGLTASEVRVRVAALLEEKDLIRNPQVSITIKEYLSQPVVVMGTVKNPGQYQLSRPARLVDVLAMAGGILQQRSTGIAIVQKADRDQDAAAGNATDRSISIDLKQLFTEGKTELNIPIAGGDVITIPEREVKLFYVLGEVQHPGAFELPPDAPLMVTQAMAWAGGPMKTAKANDGILVRLNSQGQREDIQVELKNILSGKRPDLVIQANDLIFIPGSTFKNIGYGLLGMIPRTLSDAIVRGPYYYNR